MHDSIRHMKSTSWVCNGRSENFQQLLLKFSRHFPMILQNLSRSLMIHATSYEPTLTCSLLPEQESCNWENVRILGVFHERKENIISSIIP